VALDLRALLAYTKEQGASDLHISAGLPPLLRLRGEIMRIDMAPLTRDDAIAGIYDILSDEQRMVFEERRDIDFALSIPDVARFRANILVQERGLAAVFRVIPTQIKTLDELGMPKVLKELAGRERGLIVVTGPTGSGKSTTLAAMVD